MRTKKNTDRIKQFERTEELRKKTSMEEVQDLKTMAFLLLYCVFIFVAFIVFLVTLKH